MRKMLFGLVAVLACGSMVSAEDQSLAGLGLDSLSAISDTDGMDVRGLAAGAQASGLSNLGAIFYDVATGSKANVDLVNFSQSTDVGSLAAGATSSAQNYNAIGLSGPLAVVFPGTTTASVSAFSAGGSSQAATNFAATTFVVPAPINNPFFP